MGKNGRILPRPVKAGVVSRPVARVGELRPRRGDRWHVLTDETLSLVERLMESNPERKRIYTLLGVDKGTFFTWVTKGRALEVGDPSPYRKLAEIIERADVLFERACLDGIIEAAKGFTEDVVIHDSLRGDSTRKVRRSGDWKALAWLLEKRFPKKYADRKNVQIEGKITLEAALSAIAHGEDPREIEGPR